MADEGREAAVPFVLEGGLRGADELAGEMGGVRDREETGPREAFEDGFAEVGEAGEPAEWEGRQLGYVQGIFNKSVGRSR